MSEVDQAMKAVLDVSLSVMLRKTALRKLRSMKKSVELGNALVQLLQNVEDESLQRDCLGLAGEMCVRQAVDVVFPIAVGKGMNARYAVNTLGRLGGAKAYRYLFDVTIRKDSGTASYDAKRAMQEIKRREPNVEEEIKAELAALGGGFTELTRESLDLLSGKNQKDLASAPMNLASDVMDLESDSMDLKSDPVNLQSDSDLDESGVELRGMIQAMRENASLKSKVQKLENECNASKSLLAEQESRSSHEQELLVKSANLEKKNQALQKELNLVNDAFRGAKKDWEAKLALLEKKVKAKSEKSTVTSEALKVNSLKSRIDGQQIIVDKLEQALNREQRKNERLENEQANKKNSNVGCIVMAVVVFLGFVFCR